MKEPATGRKSNGLLLKGNPTLPPSLCVLNLWRYKSDLMILEGRTAILLTLKNVDSFKTFLLNIQIFWKARGCSVSTTHDSFKSFLSEMKSFYQLVNLIWAKHVPHVGALKWLASFHLVCRNSTVSFMSLSACCINNALINFNNKCTIFTESGLHEVIKSLQIKRMDYILYDDISTFKHVNVATLLQ